MHPSSPPASGPPSPPPPRFLSKASSFRPSISRLPFEASSSELSALDDLASSPQGLRHRASSSEPSPLDHQKLASSFIPSVRDLRTRGSHYLKGFRRYRYAALQLRTPVTSLFQMSTLLYETCLRPPKVSSTWPPASGHTIQAFLKLQASI